MEMNEGNQQANNAGRGDAAVMTREEQIRNKARELGQAYFPDSANIWARSNVEAAYVENACVEMAEWVNRNPGWISVKDDLPKHNTDENGLVSFPMVLVCLYDGYRDTSYYDDMGEEWGDYDGEVEYWMPMPPAPGKEEE